VTKDMQNISHDTEHQEYHQNQKDLQHEGQNHEDMWYKALIMIIFLMMTLLL
jgi:hypothetical protein